MPVEVNAVIGHDRVGGRPEPSPGELVVLVDGDGRPCGVAAKASVHTRTTPLHLAFSCYVFDDDGRLLLTRRSLGKQTWPGVWTNSCCGHPAPQEGRLEAVERRVAQELSLALRDVTCLLPDFRYTATDAGGLTENELCPVFAARAAGPVRPDPDEVAEHAWVSWSAVTAIAASAAPLLSPWAVRQVRELADGRLVEPYLRPGS